MTQHKKTKLDKEMLTRFKKIFAKKSVQIGIAILIVVMFMLGFTINWNCSSRGWECGGGYAPPDPDDVNKIIKLEKNK